MGEQKTFLQQMKTFGMWVCGVYACLLIFDFAYVKITGQTPQQSLLVVTYSNITSASKLDGCLANYPCVNNISQFTKQSSQISFRAVSSGVGSWSVDMQYADNSPAGPWTSFGSTAQVTQASTTGIGYGIGPSSITKPYHDYIRFVMTGNVIIQNYSGTRQFWWLPSVAALAFPITATQGGTVGAFVVDQLYNTLSAGCTAAHSAGLSLMLTVAWTAQTTQSINCNIMAFNGGVITPAANQTVTLAGSFGGDLTQHFNLSASGSLVVLSGALVSVYPQWWGALCNGSTDDATAFQRSINTRLSITVTPGICEIGTTLQYASAGQQIRGAGMGKYGTAGVGQTVLQAKSGLSGPILVMNYQQTGLYGIKLDGNAIANPDLLYTCGSGSLAEQISVMNSAGPGILLTNTIGPYTTTDCPNPTGGTNDNMEIRNSLVQLNATYGIDFTATAADINNNLIRFTQLAVQNNVKTGLRVRQSTVGWVVGGDYSFNGDNATSTQDYCIQLGAAGDLGATEGWQLQRMDTEGCNLNTTTGPPYTSRGPLVLFSGSSVRNNIYSNGDPSGVGSAPGKFIQFAGPGCWYGDFYISGTFVVCAAGTSGDPDYQFLDTSYSATNPLFSFGDSSTGFRPRFDPLKFTGASGGFGLVTSDSNGLLSTLNSAQLLQTAPLLAGGDIPQNYRYIPVDTTTAPKGIIFNSTPFAGETHTIFIAAGTNYVTLSAQGSPPSNQINFLSADGTTSGPVIVLAKLGQSITVHFDTTLGWIIDGGYPDPVFTLTAPGTGSCPSAITHTGGTLQGCSIGFDASGNTIYSPWFH